MTASISVEAAAESAVVVKRAVGESAAEAIRREGERLRRTSHPGVVSVIRSAPIPGGWELVMAHGGRSLSTLQGADPCQLAGIIVGAASTLADLHEIGITHGRIEASHVLLSNEGRPMLCGFGTGHDAAGPEDDVAMLGALLAELLGSDGEPEPIPERRWRRRRGWHGWDRRALLLLADQAMADEPTRRPTARRLAAAIAEAVPVPQPMQSEDADRGLPLDPIERLRPTEDTGKRTRARRASGVLVTVVGVALMVLAVVRSHPAGEEPVAPVEDDVLTDVRVAHPVVGSVLVDHGRRYRVGQHEDHLLVDDWSCDGLPTPALFRPATREVFVFDRWAVGQEVSIPPAAVVPLGVAMVSTSGPDGCPELAVRTTDGGLVPVASEGIR